MAATPLSNLAGVPLIFLPLIGGMAGMAFSSWMLHKVQTRLDPRPAPQAAALRPHGAAAWSRYVAVRVLALLALVAFFRTDRRIALLVLGVVLLVGGAVYWRDRVQPLRRQGATGAEVLALLALLLVTLAGWGLFLYRTLAAVYGPA